MGEAQDDVSDTAHALRLSVLRLHRRLRRERSGDGLSLTALSVLGRLVRTGPVSASEIADGERIAPQSVARVVVDLERRGLIQRLPDAADRRRVLLRVAPAGRELIAEDRRQRDEWLATAMAGLLTQAEQDILRIAATLLDRLAEA